MYGIKELISTDIDILINDEIDQPVIILDLVFGFDPDISVLSEKVSGHLNYFTINGPNDTLETQKFLESRKDVTSSEIISVHTKYGLAIDLPLDDKVKASIELTLSDKTKRKLNVEISTDGDKITDYLIKGGK